MKRDIPHFRIGLLLTEAGILEPRQLDSAIQQGEQEGWPFLKVLVSAGSLSHNELKAVIQAQSLIWSGVLDVEKAIRLLAIVHAHNISFDDGLRAVGGQPIVDSIARMTQGAGISRLSASQRPAAAGSGTRLCQYCATPLAARSNLCSYCTGENSPVATSFKDRLPQMEKAPATNSQTRVRASAPPRDPVVMAFLSGCCLPGLGQILIGQPFKGVCLSLLTLTMAYFTAGLSSLFLNPLIAIDAYLLAEKLRSRKPVGLWESF